MLAEDALNAWIATKPVSIDGIAAHRFPGRGVGIVAKRCFEAGDIPLIVPTSFFRSIYDVDEVIARRLQGCSTTAILAVELMLGSLRDGGGGDDDDDNDCSDNEEFSPWLDILPTQQDLFEMMPLLWCSELQALLPSAALEILGKQRLKLEEDWRIVNTGFPECQYDVFVRWWFTVSTRTFYYKRPEDDSRKSDDCAALIPFADCFNHADAGCEVVFSPKEYKFWVDRRIEEGDEIFISYGNHGNDFLLVEYGFVLDRNNWDEVSLDEAIISLFSPEDTSALKRQGYWGAFVLDANMVCYRTQVALRMLCMPSDEWYFGLANGFDDEDEYQVSVDKLVLDVIQSFQKVIRQRLSQLSDIDDGLQFQRDVLVKRWVQMSTLLEAAFKSLQRRNSVVNNDHDAEKPVES